MALDQTCRRFIGRHLFVVPYYGNGWHREDTKPATWEWEDMIGPESFNLLVEAFLELDEQMIGIRGKITEKGHIFDGYWCLACIRMRGEFDFEEKPAQYMVWIARNEPRFSPSVDKAVYEYIIPDKSALCLCGYGAIAESPARVQRYVEMAATTRSRIKEDKRKGE